MRFQNSVIRAGIMIATAVAFLFNPEVNACTSAIISAELNPYGRPILWKNRDTSAADNKVEYVPSKDGKHSYVALFNASDRKLEEAWIGMNDAGFAVMNTASYNLKDDDVEQGKMDREGFIMTVALESCKTVDDFETLLTQWPRPMGVEANFGVIDASGAGAYFETNNDSFTRFNLEDAENGYMVRTNYSHSGRPDEGYGFIREANAQHLLEPYAASRAVTPEVLTEVLSRSFYHDLLKKDFSRQPDRWVIDQDFIPRFTSTATVAIEGCIPVLESEEIPGDFICNEYVMWTGLGYPPVSEIMAVWCSDEGVVPGLRGLGVDGHSEIADEAARRKKDVFSIHKGNGDKYIDMHKLFNSENSGYVQVLTKKNKEIYDTVRRNRDRHKKGGRNRGN